MVRTSSRKGSRSPYCGDWLIWPLSIAYFDTVRLVVAWCELRGGFRHFRTDRISRAEFLEEGFQCSRERLLAQWVKLGLNQPG